MKKLFFRVFLLLGISSLHACQTLTKIPLTDVPPLIRMEKGMSMGRYPVYEITIYNNQIAEYKGRRYTPKLGTWVKKLDEAEWQTLQQQIKSTNIWQYPSFIRSNIPDLPLVSITQFDGEDSKTVTGKEARPDPIMALEQSLESLSNREGWVLKEAIDFELPGGVMPNQLRIELKPGVYVSNWIYRYAKQEMQLLTELPDKSNYWLVSYNPTVIFPKEMEKLLNYDDLVVSYSFNPTAKKKKR